jgi:uncharacterized protein (DUF1800 family)
VERLLAPEEVDDSAAEVRVDELGLEDLDEERIKLFQAWHVRLQSTRRPLLEKMTYFWHDHFATAIHKVSRPSLMLQQNAMLREHALGSFRELLLAVARDPAMLVWLDNRTNSRTAPNENYARELMELHTLGEGNGYTEVDIQEAARALTGWRLTRDGGVRFVPPLHDRGEKSVLGVDGALDDEQLVDLIAERRETADYVGAKLWRFFALPEPGPELIGRTSDAYVASGGSISAMVRTILLSEEMYSPAAYRTRVKASIEVVIGIERALEIETDGRLEIPRMRAMGQLLFDPPDPAGWTGDEAWINSTTMLARSNLANDVTRLRTRWSPDIPALLRGHGATGSAAEIVDWVLDLLVGGDVDDVTREALIEHVGGPHHFDFEEAAANGALNGVVYLALSMPLFHVT